MKILAIDDSKTMRLAIKIAFAAEGVEVVAVSRGSEAVPRAKQMPADLVLIDHTLAAGEPSGLEVVAALRADAQTAGIPVFLMTHPSGGVDEAAARAGGADGVVAKPFETQQLIDLARQWQGKRSTAGAGAPAASSPARPAAAPAPPTAGAQPAAARGPSPGPLSAGPAARPGAPAPVARPAAAATPTAPAPGGPAGPAAAPSGTAGAGVAPVAARPPVARPVPGVGAAPPAGAAAAPPTRPGPAAAGPGAAVKPAASAPASIPIAIPIPFVAADAATPKILERLGQSGAGHGLDPKVAAAIVALSREVVEQVVWEVVPELAEQLLRERVARD